MLKLKEDHTKEFQTDDFMFDLILGLYLKPEEFLDDESSKKVKDAISTLQEFEQLLTDADILVAY